MECHPLHHTSQYWKLMVGNIKSVCKKFRSSLASRVFGSSLGRIGGVRFHIPRKGPGKHVDSSSGRLRYFWDTDVGRNWKCTLAVTSNVDRNYLFYIPRKF